MNMVVYLITAVVEGNAIYHRETPHEEGVGRMINEAISAVYSLGFMPVEEPYILVESIYEDEPTPRPESMIFYDQFEDYYLDEWEADEESGRVRTISGKPHTPRKLKEDKGISPEEAARRISFQSDDWTSAWEIVDLEPYETVEGDRMAGTIVNTLTNERVDFDNAPVLRDYYVEPLDVYVDYDDWEDEDDEDDEWDMDNIEQEELVDVKDAEYIFQKRVSVFADDEDEAYDELGYIHEKEYEMVEVKEAPLFQKKYSPKQLAKMNEEKLRKLLIKTVRKNGLEDSFTKRFRKETLEEVVGTDEYNGFDYYNLIYYIMEAQKEGSSLEAWEVLGYDSKAHMKEEMRIEVKEGEEVDSNPTGGNTGDQIVSWEHNGLSSPSGPPSDIFWAEGEKKNCGCGQDPCITYGAEDFGFGDYKVAVVDNYVCLFNNNTAREWRAFYRYPAEDEYPPSDGKLDPTGQRNKKRKELDRNHPHRKYILTLLEENLKGKISEEKYNQLMSSGLRAGFHRSYGPVVALAKKYPQLDLGDEGKGFSHVALWPIPSRHRFTGKPLEAEGFDDDGVGPKHMASENKTEFRSPLDDSYEEIL